MSFCVTQRGIMKDTELSKLLKQHEDDTRQFAQFIMEAHGFAVIINRLANYILDEPCSSDNAKYEAEEAIKLVLPHL
jgi:hypothetical protein